MNDEQIAAMVGRFLAWQLPDDFMPDGGVRFDPSPLPGMWPRGTNLLSATQAEGMVRAMVGATLPSTCPLCGLFEGIDQFVAGLGPRQRDNRAAAQTYREDLTGTVPTAAHHDTLADSDGDDGA